MRKQSLFSKERMVYWPGEFSEVVDLLNGRDRNGKVVTNPLYTLNVGAIALAAALGVKDGRKREVGSDRKEISTNTFSGQGLESYLFLIPLLGNPNSGTELLRPENEDQLIKEFERYAAGGLEILAGEVESSAGKAMDILIQSIMLKSHSEEQQPSTLLPLI